jgi:hypothetical protein
VNLKILLAGLFLLPRAVIAETVDPLVVAGMTLDAPFTMERCLQGRKTSMEKRTSPCWVAMLGDEKKKEPEFREVQWPGKYNAGPFGYGTTVMINNEILTAISFKTIGLSIKILTSSN